METMKGMDAPSNNNNECGWDFEDLEDLEEEEEVPQEKCEEESRVSAAASSAAVSSAASSGVKNLEKVCKDAFEMISLFDDESNTGSDTSKSNEFVSKEEIEDMYEWIVNILSEEMNVDHDLDGDDDDDNETMERKDVMWIFNELKSRLDSIQIHIRQENQIKRRALVQLANALNDLSTTPITTPNHKNEDLPKQQPTKSTKNQKNQQIISELPHHPANNNNNNKEMDNTLQDHTTHNGQSNRLQHHQSQTKNHNTKPKSSLPSSSTTLPNAHSHASTTTTPTSPPTFNNNNTQTIMQQQQEQQRQQLTLLQCTLDERTIQLQSLQTQMTKLQKQIQMERNTMELRHCGDIARITYLEELLRNNHSMKNTSYPQSRNTILCSSSSSSSVPMTSPLHPNTVNAIALSSPLMPPSSSSSTLPKPKSPSQLELNNHTHNNNNNNNKITKKDQEDDCPFYDMDTMRYQIIALANALEESELCRARLIEKMISSSSSSSSS